MRKGLYEFNLGLSVVNFLETMFDRDLTMKEELQLVQLLLVYPEEEVLRVAKSVAVDTYEDGQERRFWSSLCVALLHRHLHLIGEDDLISCG